MLILNGPSHVPWRWSNREHLLGMFHVQLIACLTLSDFYSMIGRGRNLPSQMANHTVENLYSRSVRAMRTHDDAFDARKYDGSIIEQSELTDI